MVSRDISRTLVRMLDRSEDTSFIDKLHLLIVTFLKKLSIYSENKDDMGEEEIIDRLKPIMLRDDEVRGGCSSPSFDLFTSLFFFFFFLSPPFSFFFFFFFFFF